MDPKTRNSGFLENYSGNIDWAIVAYGDRISK
jgi:hypothetical protein